VDIYIDNQPYYEGFVVLSGIAITGILQRYELYSTNPHAHAIFALLIAWLFPPYNNTPLVVLLTLGTDFQHRQD
jgi:hypothetical protein